MSLRLNRWHSATSACARSLFSFSLDLGTLHAAHLFKYQTCCTQTRLFSQLISTTTKNKREVKATVWLCAASFRRHADSQRDSITMNNNNKMVKWGRRWGGGGGGGGGSNWNNKCTMYATCSSLSPSCICFLSWKMGENKELIDDAPWIKCIIHSPPSYFHLIRSLFLLFFVKQLFGCSSSMFFLSIQSQWWTKFLIW